MISLAIFIADQWTKRLFFVERVFDPDWIATFLRLTQHKNTGIGFDLPLPTWMILTVSILLIAAVGWMLIVGYLRKERSLILPASVILGGAFGNFFDRISFGYVRDWLLIGNRSVVNLGDAAILFGALWLFFSLDHVDNVFSSAKSNASDDH